MFSKKVTTIAPDLTITKTVSYTSVKAELSLNITEEMFEGLMEFFRDTRKGGDHSISINLHSPKEETFNIKCPVNSW